MINYSNTNVYLIAEIGDKGTTIVPYTTYYQDVDDIIGAWGEQIKRHSSKQSTTSSV